MGLEEIKNTLKRYKQKFQEKYHLNTLGIFGSYVRNEQKPGSDVDILVDFSSPISLFEFIEMEDELSSVLKVKVDLVARDSLKPYIGQRILGEVELV